MEDSHLLMHMIANFSLGDIEIVQSKSSPGLVFRPTQKDPPNAVHNHLISIVPTGTGFLSGGNRGRNKWAKSACWASNHTSTCCLYAIYLQEINITMGQCL